MPVELLVTYANGEKKRYYMALRMMRGEKKFNDNIETVQLADWPWTHPNNTIVIEGSIFCLLKDCLDVFNDKAILT